MCSSTQGFKQSWKPGVVPNIGWFLKYVKPTQLRKRHIWLQIVKWSHHGLSDRGCHGILETASVCRPGSTVHTLNEVSTPPPNGEQTHPVCENRESTDHASLWLCHPVPSHREGVGARCQRVNSDVIFHNNQPIQTTAFIFPKNSTVAHTDTHTHTHISLSHTHTHIYFSLSHTHTHTHTYIYFSLSHTHTTQISEKCIINFKYQTHLWHTYTYTDMDTHLSHKQIEHRNTIYFSPFLTHSTHSHTYSRIQTWYTVTHTHTHTHTYTCNHTQATQIQTEAHSNKETHMFTYLGGE